MWNLKCLLKCLLVSFQLFCLATPFEKHMFFSFLFSFFLLVLGLFFFVILPFFKLFFLFMTAWFCFCFCIFYWLLAFQAKHKNTKQQKTKTTNQNPNARESYETPTMLLIYRRRAWHLYAQVNTNQEIHITRWQIEDDFLT